MKKNKGFTLIELLAVIVILGVLLAIAIPKVSQYINGSRKKSFVDAGQLFINSVREDATAEEIPSPIATNDVVIVTLDVANLNKAKAKSPWGGKYILNKSYVAIVNVGTSTNPKYEYYFAAQDSKGYAIPLTNEKELDADKVVANAKNKMEVTIQSLCGSEEGTTSVYPSISGLPTPMIRETVSTTPTETTASTGEGETTTTTPATPTTTQSETAAAGWNATIFSTEDCGKAENE